MARPAIRMSTLTQPQFAASSTPAPHPEPAPRPTPGQPDASIVIVSFNTREVLRECLDSIAGEAAGLAIEILIVDNNSSDGSQAMIEAEFPDVTLVRSPINLLNQLSDQVDAKEAAEVRKNQPPAPAEPAATPLITPPSRPVAARTENSTLPPDPSLN